MTTRISTGLRNAMLDGGAVEAYASQTSGVLVVGRPYRIHLFVAGDDFTNVGGTNATGSHFIATGTTPTTWTNSSDVSPMRASSGIKEYMRHGFINIYTGSQPASADTAATGTLLGTVSVSAIGLTFDAAVAGALSKAAAETWAFTGLAAGTAGWFRMYSAAGTPGSTSTTEPRIDGSIATTGGDMNLSNISVTIGAPNTCDVYSFTLPAA